MNKKCLLILLDGLGDRAAPSLENRTPLQAAATPFLDDLAAAGSCGMYHPLACGTALPSEIAHLLIFGYALNDFCGRGALEALGYGVDLSPGEAAFMAKLSSVTEREGILKLANPRPAMTDSEAETLSRLIASYHGGEVSLSFTRTRGALGILTLTGKASPFLTDTDPFQTGAPLPALVPLEGTEGDENTVKSAAAMNAFLRHCYNILDRHEINERRRHEGREPVNFLITQRGGALKDVEPFYKKWGMKGISIASGAVYRGLARYIGLDFHQAVDSDEPGRDLAERIRHAAGLLDDYKFFHIHTKAPDEAAHQKAPLEKRDVIASLDHGIAEGLAPLRNREDILVIVTADHSTPSAGPLIHSGETVPLIFHGKDVRVDEVTSFNEISCARGCLGTLRGNELMLMALNYLDRARLAGTADSPRPALFWPGTCEPFRIDET